MTTEQVPSKELVRRIDDCLNCFWIDGVAEVKARGLLREAMEALRATAEPGASHDLDVHSVMNNDPRRKRCFEGECARTACTNRPAVFFNRSTRWYYCEACAQQINHYAQEELCAIVAGGAEALTRAGQTKPAEPCEKCGGSGRLMIYDKSLYMGQLCSPIGDEPCPACSSEGERDE